MVTGCLGEGKACFLIQFLWILTCFYGCNNGSFNQKIRYDLNESILYCSNEMKINSTNLLMRDHVSFYNPLHISFAEVKAPKSKRCGNIVFRQSIEFTNSCSVLNDQIKEMVQKGVINVQSRDSFSKVTFLATNELIEFNGLKLSEYDSTRYERRKADYQLVIYCYFFESMNTQKTITKALTDDYLVKTKDDSVVYYAAVAKKPLYISEALLSTLND